MSEAERIEALEARVQEVERLLRTVVHFNDMRPSTAQTYSYTWHPPLAQGKIYPASGSGGGGQP